MKHLSIEELAALADPAMEAASRKTAMAHMESCAPCRARLASLMTLRSALGGAPTRPLLSTPAPGPECVPTEEMGDYLGGRLTADMRERFAAHVAGCDECFGRAAYFESAAARMTRATLQAVETPPRFLAAVAPGLAKRGRAEPVGESMSARVRRWFASPLPAYAAAAAMLVLMLSSNGAREVIDLNSQTAFAIYERPLASGPSFGFSDAGRKVDETPARLFVTRTGGRVVFTWAAVEGAKEYHFVIEELAPSGPREIHRAAALAPRAEVDGEALEPGRAYRWRVAGSIGDERIFAAAGQFTLAR
ncbi:MAG: zf-HC2 domain-containing protein [Nitrospinae bacterium]|nr:zf-HC2 domain-containing protein [Nitrospinota bacterium]